MRKFSKKNIVIKCKEKHIIMYTVIASTDSIIELNGPKIKKETQILPIITQADFLTLQTFFVEKMWDN